MDRAAPVLNGARRVCTFGFAIQHHRRHCGSSVHVHVFAGKNPRLSQIYARNARSYIADIAPVCLLGANELKCVCAPGILRSTTTRTTLKKNHPHTHTHSTPVEGGFPGLLTTVQQTGRALLLWSGGGFDCLTARVCGERTHSSSSSNNHRKSPANPNVYLNVDVVVFSLRWNAVSSARIIESHQPPPPGVAFEQDF